IVAGSVATANNHDDYCIRKYDTAGNVVWTKTQDGTASTNDHVLSVCSDRNSNVYVTGESEGTNHGYDVLTIKYNPSGTKQWSVRYDGSAHSADAGVKVKVDTSGYIYVAGYRTGTNTQKDIVTIKYNSSGTQQWLSSYNATANLNDVAASLALDSLGNVYVAGETYASSTNSNFVTIKYNSGGTQQWASTYNGPASVKDNANSIAIDKTLSVYVTGSSEDSNSNLDLATIRYNADGTVNWTARYDGPASSTDIVTMLTLDVAGDVLITAGSIANSSDMDYITLCYSNSGTLNWTERLDGVSNQYDQTSSIYTDELANIYLAGVVTDSINHYQYATVKYNQPDKNLLAVENKLHMLATGLLDVSKVDTVKNIVNDFARRCVDGYYHIYFTDLFEKGTDSGIDIKARMNKKIQSVYKLPAGKDHTGKIIASLNYRGIKFNPHIALPDFHELDSMNVTDDDAVIGYAASETNYPLPCINYSSTHIDRGGGSGIPFWLILGRLNPDFIFHNFPAIGQIPVVILNCTAQSWGSNYTECEVCPVSTTYNGVPKNYINGPLNEEISIVIGWEGSPANDGCFDLYDANEFDDAVLDEPESFAILSKLPGFNYYDWEPIGNDVAIKKLIHPIRDNAFGEPNMAEKYGDVLTLCVNTTYFNNIGESTVRFALGQGGVYKIERTEQGAGGETKQLPLYFAFPYSKSMWWTGGPDMTLYYGVTDDNTSCPDTDRRRIIEENEVRVCVFCEKGPVSFGYDENEITDWLATTDYSFISEYWLSKSINIGFSKNDLSYSYIGTPDFNASGLPPGCTPDPSWIHVVSATLSNEGWYEIEKKFPNDTFYSDDILHVRVRAMFKNNHAIDECRDITLSDLNSEYSFLNVQIRGDIKDYESNSVNYQIDIYK
ncbi:MAG: hypothetical protein LH473_06705, partial [Chitinophagales bacterium]|nr:hypothetical protein [Chitinophagales bacterium]